MYSKKDKLFLLYQMKLPYFENKQKFFSENKKNDSSPTLFLDIE